MTLWLPACCATHAVVTGYDEAGNFIPGISSQGAFVRAQSCHDLQRGLYGFVNAMQVFSRLSLTFSFYFVVLVLISDVCLVDFVFIFFAVLCRSFFLNVF